MARPQIIVNKAEIEEIIALKILDLGGIKSKLTYNNVWNFNKKLVEDKIKRNDGEQFNLYGYTFWAYGYNGEDYYGKVKIDEIKSNNNVILAGDSFNVEIEDILIMVDKFHNKPQELSKRLIKAFEKDRKKAKSLKEQNDKLNTELAKLRKNINLIEQGFATVFYNSIYTDNSINDVMSLKKTGDLYVRDELKKMFNKDEDKIAKILNQNSKLNDDKNVINIQDKAKARTKLEEEGL